MYIWLPTNTFIPRHHRHLSSVATMWLIGSISAKCCLYLPKKRWLDKCVASCVCNCSGKEHQLISQVAAGNWAQVVGRSNCYHKVLLFLFQETSRALVTVAVQEVHIPGLHTMRYLLHGTCIFYRSKLYTQVKIF